MRKIKGGSGENSESLDDTKHLKQKRKQRPLIVMDLDETLIRSVA